MSKEALVKCPKFLSVPKFLSGKSASSLIRARKRRVVHKPSIGEEFAGIIIDALRMATKPVVEPKAAAVELIPTRLTGDELRNAIKSALATIKSDPILKQCTEMYLIQYYEKGEGNVDWEPILQIGSDYYPSWKYSSKKKRILLQAAVYKIADKVRAKLQPDV